MAAFLLCVLLAAMLLIRATDAPPIWFDEGVILSVARNWSETGLYGLQENGRMVAPDLLSTGLPAVLPIALSFRLLGVGAWQGRLPGALFVVAAMAASYILARRLYNQKVGLATLAVQLLVSATNEHLHPVLLGRQALGEMPAVAYLLGGYVCLAFMSRRPRLYLPLAVALWGLALASKPQFLPFFVASLLPPLLLLLVGRDRRWTWLAAGLAASLAAYWALNALPGLLIRSEGMAGNQGVNLSTGLASKLDLILVSNTSLHLAVLKQIVEIAPPALFGLAYAAWQWFRRGRPVDDRGVLWLALWTFVVTWMFWWVAFSIGWLRYLFPALFASGIFTAALLHDLTGGFALPRREGRARLWRWGRWAAGVVVAVALLWQSVPPTLHTLQETYGREPDNSMFEMAAYLNSQTPPGSRIETYETELFFLLNRPYHYPPNEVQDQLNRHLFLGRDVQIDYDALAADPDYLVVGSMAKMWHLYDALTDSGSFRLVRSDSRYDLYQRVR